METTGSLIFLCTGWNFFIISTVHKCEEYSLCPQTEQDDLHVRTFDLSP